MTGMKQVLNISNSLTASSEFCHLLLIFANSLDLDQARQNVRPDLDSTSGHSESVPEGIF